MPHKTALATLIELATRKAEAAAQALGRVLRAHEEARQTLEVLVQYRSEYLARAGDSLRVGTSPLEISNFQGFMAKLDEAIHGQSCVVDETARQIEAARSHWQHEERKKLSYRLLDERAARAALQSETRQEQKRMDETAARARSFHEETGTP